MSRCFPYPPPGYMPSKGTNEALIESIKLQKEREKAKGELKKEKKDKKKEKNDKKKDKKDKKREKKEKKKSKEEGKGKQIKTIQFDQNVHGGKSLEHGKGGIPQKVLKDDTEQLERSNITEEHEEPSQIPSYSSDSTQNSGKRKRLASPANATRVQGGNILRIRLPSQKNIKHEISRSTVEQQPIRLPTENLTKRDAVGFQTLPSRPPVSQKPVKFEIRGCDEQPCSTSGRADVPDEQIGSSRRTENDKVPLRADQKLKMIAPTPPSPVTRHDDSSHVEYIFSNPSSKRFEKKRKVADQYRDLILNWNSPPTFTETTFMETDEDDDWLFGSKKEVNRPEKMPIPSTEKTCSSRSTLCFQAHFLPEANIYALPYAIPF